MTAERAKASADLFGVALATEKVVPIANNAMINNIGAAARCLRYRDSRFTVCLSLSSKSLD